MDYPQSIFPRRRFIHELLGLRHLPLRHPLTVYTYLRGNFLFFFSYTVSVFRLKRKVKIKTFTINR